MAYTAREWSRGDKITADALNHMEQGIYDAQNGYECSEGRETVINASVTVTNGMSEFSDGTPFPFEVGDNVIANFDGIEYELVVSEYNNGNYTFLVIGDTNTYGFRIMYNPLYPNDPPVLEASLDGTYSVQVAISAEVVDTSECFEKAVQQIVGSSCGGLVFGISGEGTCDGLTYTEFNVTFQDFIDAAMSGTPIWFAQTTPTDTRVHMCQVVEYSTLHSSSGYYYAYISYASNQTTDHLDLYCDTTSGRMRDVNCWGDDDA